MNHFSTRSCERSVHNYLEALPLLLKDPRIHYTPAAHQPDAIVLQQVAWFRRSAVFFEICRRSAGDTLCRQNLSGDHTGIRRESNSKSYIQTNVNHIQTGIGQHQVNLNIRKLSLELCSERSDQPPANLHRCAEPKYPF